MFRLVLLALIALLSSGCVTSRPSGMTVTPQDDSLARRVAAFAGSSGAHFGVVIEHLESGRRLAWNENERFELASVAKVGLLTEAVARIREGKLTLSERWTVEKNDLAAGSGLLDEFDPGLTPTVRDILRVMIAVSDNTAANIVYDRMTPAAVNVRLESLGFRTLRVLSRIPDREPKETVNSRWKGLRLGEASPAELALFYKRMANGGLLDAEGSKLIYELMKTPRSLDRLMRFIRDREGVTWAGKSGTMDGVRCDSGILTTSKGTFVMVALASRVPDGPRANTAMAEIARAVVDTWSRSLPDVTPLLR